MKKLKAPFGYFGGKARAADLVWQRFGDVPNFIEPFAGSLAVLLARPHAPRTETVNDINGYIVNFWRAIQKDPVGVANWCNNPVHEIELHAVHTYLMTKGREILEQSREDMEFYDSKLAGLWAWGMALCIGDGWCVSENKGIPSLYAYTGVIATLRNGGGIDGLIERLQELAKRLEKVRVCCGDWTRILTKSVTYNCNIGSHGQVTGVFLDPPYEDFQHLYGTASCSSAVREWAIANGDNPLFRIALCGYEGEHEMPDSWECVAWKANGGYSNQREAKDNDNKHKERIYFSPHCLKARQGSLFEEEA